MSRDTQNKPFQDDRSKEQQKNPAQKPEPLKANQKKPSEKKDHEQY